jgi:hypothetical protein
MAQVYTLGVMVILKFMGTGVYAVKQKQNDGALVGAEN